MQHASDYLAQLPKQHVIVAADVVSALAVLGAFAGFMPPLAALGALAWYVVQIYESKTFQKWSRARRHARRRKRLTSTKRSR